MLQCIGRLTTELDRDRFDHCLKDFEVETVKKAYESRNAAVNTAALVNGSSGFWQKVGGYLKGKVDFKSKVQGYVTDTITNGLFNGAVKLASPHYRPDGSVSANCRYHLCSGANGTLYPSRRAADQSHESWYDLSGKTTRDQDDWDAWEEESEQFLAAIEGTQDQRDALSEWESTARRQTRDFEELERDGGTKSNNEKDDPDSSDPDDGNREPDTSDPEDGNRGPDTPDPDDGDPDTPDIDLNGKSKVCDFEVSSSQGLAAIYDPLFQCTDEGTADAWDFPPETVILIFEGQGWVRGTRYLPVFGGVRRAGGIFSRRSFLHRDHSRRVGHEGDLPAARQLLRRDRDWLHPGTGIRRESRCHRDRDGQFKKRGGNEGDRAVWRRNILRSQRALWPQL